MNLYKETLQPQLTLKKQVSINMFLLGDNTVSNTINHHSYKPKNMKCKFSHTIKNDIIIAKKQVSINIFLLEGNTISNTIKHKAYKIRKMIKTECMKCKVYHIIENEMTGVKK